MWPDRVSNPGPLTYESGALPIGLLTQAVTIEVQQPLLLLYLLYNYYNSLTNYHVV